MGASDWQAVIDIGSTTVDIIPLRAGRIATPALTDRQRLERGQLVYTGMQRTAIQAIVRQLQVGHCTCPIVAERFATIDDVNLILGAVPEQPTDRESADGRPRTRDHAMARLARMIGDDAENLSPDLLTDMARQVAVAQAEQVRDRLLRNLHPSGPSTASTDGRRYPVFVSGHGRPLVERLKHDPQLPRSNSATWTIGSRLRGRCARGRGRPTLGNGHGRALSDANPAACQTISGHQTTLTMSASVVVERGERLSPALRWLCLLAAMALLALLATARSLSPSARDRGTHEQLGLPPCLAVLLWDTPCPACGMTTSWALATRGHLWQAGRANLGGLILAAIALAYLPASCYFFVSGRATPGRWFSWLLAVGLALATTASCLQWIFRVWT